MSLREQFEAWWKSQRAAYGMNIAWQAYQAAHAVNAELLEACEQCLRHIEQDEFTHGRPFAAGNVARAAIKKARGEA